MKMKSLLEDVGPEIKLIWNNLDMKIIKKIEEEGERLPIPEDAAEKMGWAYDHPEKLMAFLAYECQYIPGYRMDARWAHFVNVAENIVLGVLSGKLDPGDAIGKDNIRKSLSKYALFFKDTDEIAYEENIEVSDAMVQVIRRYILEYIIPCMELDRWIDTLEKTIGTLHAVKKIK